MERQVKKDQRIDIRVSLEEKRIFQRAYELSGERSFSGFVTRIIKKKSTEIINENNRILTSERDSKLFFDTIFSDAEPNEKLKKAAKKFKLIQDKNT